MDSCNQIARRSWNTVDTNERFIRSPEYDMRYKRISLLKNNSTSSCLEDKYKLKLNQAYNVCQTNFTLPNRPSYNCEIIWPRYTNQNRSGRNPQFLTAKKSFRNDFLVILNSVNLKAFLSQWNLDNIRWLWNFEGRFGLIKMQSVIPEWTERHGQLLTAK